MQTGGAGAGMPHCTRTVCLFIPESGCGRRAGASENVQIWQAIISLMIAPCVMSCIFNKSGFN